MGKFWENAMSEFGTKTGKALGNSLYGDKVDDMRVGVNRGQSSRSRHDDDDDDDDLKENLKQQQLKELLGMVFDSSDPQSIVQQLTAIVANIDVWLLEEGSDVVKAATSKFNTGMAILTSVDPNNSMLNFFAAKCNEWEMKKIQDKRRLCE